MRPRFIVLKARTIRRQKKVVSNVSKFALLPGPASLVLTGRLPTSSVSQIQPIPSGNLRLNGSTPTSIASMVISVPTGQLRLTPQTPTTQVGFMPAIPSGSLVITARALTAKTFRRRRSSHIIIRARDLLDLDFQRGSYLLYGVQPASPTTRPEWSFARSTIAYMDDGTVALTQAAINAPRINGQGLWVERAATNVLLQSQTFDDASWSKLNAGTGSAPVVTPNAVTAPDGTLTADQIVFAKGAGTTSGDYSYASQSKTGLTSGQPYDLTLYLKASSAQTIIARHVAGSAYTTLNVTTAWQRFSIVETSAGTSGSVDFGLRGSFTAVQNATVYVWGADLKLEGYPSSYVPTTTAALARGADMASISVARPNVFTLFVDADLDNLDGVARYLASWDDGTSSNYITLIRYSDNAAYIQAVQGGVAKFNRSIAGKTGARRLKMAVSYDGTQWQGAIDGAAVTATTNSAPTVNTLRLGAIYLGTGGYLCGQLNRVRVLLQPLNTAALQAMTA